MNRELMLEALRILAALNNNESVSPHRADELRRHAFPGEVDLPLDELCSRIIHRELQKPPHQ